MGFFLLMASAALACAILGPFLVLRRLALVTDAISHVLILGIVLAFLVVRDLDSPWLLIGAAATGVLTVILVEFLQKQRHIKTDAAIALVFPALLSVGVVLLSLYVPKSTHLDVDQVLLGSAEFGVADVVQFGAVALPRGVIWLGGLAIVSGCVIALLYKELTLSTFDPGLAGTLGVPSTVLHYLLMTLVSLTAVAAFDAVGPVVVVGYFVLPAMTAYLVTDRLHWMLALSGVGAVIGTGLGVQTALALSTNVGGTVATVMGLIFGVVYLVAPRRGLLAIAIERRRQQLRFQDACLCNAVLVHGALATPHAVMMALQWPTSHYDRVLRRCETAGFLTRSAASITITSSGRNCAEGPRNATIASQ